MQEISLTEYLEVPKEEFDKLCRQRAFSSGPYRDTFGDGYGEPYNPNRFVFGTLKDKRNIKAKC